MEKYGVQVDETQQKTSEKGKVRCPDCGVEMEPRPDVNVPKCPNCGTKPFEKR